MAMKRVLEPELMDDEAQARAYAGADFEEAHSRFIALFQESFPAIEVTGYVLDLGCGPGDIARRFAGAYPRCRVHGVDGSEAMLGQSAGIFAKEPELQARVKLIHGLLPNAVLPRKHYDVIISNSLLHHLHDPQALWQSIKRFSASDASVFIVDLRRPQTHEKASALVETYVASEPEILKRDFLNSLLAAFEPLEIEQQLNEAGLQNFSVRIVSDRHLAVAGRMRRETLGIGHS